MMSRVSRAQIVRRVAMAGLCLACAAFGAPRADGAQRSGTAAPARHAGETVPLAGLQCSVWQPAEARQHAPLVIFSHGFHGNRNQSTFLTSALAQAGYFVIAPNHRDAMGRDAAAAGAGRPEVPFQDPERWDDTTYQDRAKDITALLAALKASARFSSTIDWSRLALAGHSLGGYTVLGLAGGWPSWKMPELKAVLALSPVANAYVQHGDLAHLACPVMYQTGTRDLGIAPFLRRTGGVFDLTRSPAYLIDFEGAAHLAWTDLNPKFQPAIIDYSVAFLDRYVKADTAKDPARRQSAVADLRVK